MDLSWIHIIGLIISGLIVGFINTLAGGGTIISISVFMALGLPPNIANGTNRVAVCLQNLTAVANFTKKKLIDWDKSWKLSIPIIIGAAIGAIFANIISNDYFKYIFGFVICGFAILLIIEPNRWLEEREDLLHSKLKWYHYILFFVIGIYGGFIHIGIGYMILFSLILGTGHDLMKANAMKNFLVLAYIPFSIIIFALDGNVNWTFGLIHSIGNIIGAQIGAMIAIKKGTKFLRWVMIVLIFIVILQLFGLIDPSKIAVLIH